MTHTRNTPYLTIESLSVSFPPRTRTAQRVRILDRVSFTVNRGEIVGLVGESGSGKTLSSLAVMGFLPPAARIEGGAIYMDDAPCPDLCPGPVYGQPQGVAPTFTDNPTRTNILALSPDKMAQVRGRKVAMIFQSARSALNPLMRVGDQVARAIHIQTGSGQRDAYREALSLLAKVGISDAEQRARAYPHQLSGGMCQRVLVAMMLACRPVLLIADEPTTGLDVTIQAQIFELIRASVDCGLGIVDCGLRTDPKGATAGVRKANPQSAIRNHQSPTESILLITHDLGVVAETCQRVIVMYAGQIMESAPVGLLFGSPQHPYTQLLLGSVLRIDRKVTPPAAGVAVTTLRGEVTYAIQGCRFAPRCPVALPVCWQQRPAPAEVAPGHEVICHNWRGVHDVQA